jgi:hypothetical protein
MQFLSKPCAAKAACARQRRGLCPGGRRVSMHVAGLAGRWSAPTARRAGHQHSSPHVPAGNFVPHFSGRYCSCRHASSTAPNTRAQGAAWWCKQRPQHTAHNTQWSTGSSS